MTYTLTRTADSPNSGGFGQLVPSPCALVVWHWWGTPSGQSFDGIVAWLRNPASQVSAHIVLAHQRATQLLPWTSPSWANGNTWANANSITIEADPNNIVGTMDTGVELLAQLVRDGVLAPDFRLTGHRDWSSTECPGAYYDWLPSIRQRVADTLATTTTAQEDDMTPDQDAKLKDIWWRLTQPEGLATIAGAVLDVPVQRGGMEGTGLDGPTTLRNELGWLTSAQGRMINTLTALEERLARLEARQ